MVKMIWKMKVFPVHTNYMGSISLTTIFLFFILLFLFSYIKIYVNFAVSIMMILMVVSASCSLHGILNANGKNLAICWLSFSIFIFYIFSVLVRFYH